MFGAALSGYAGLAFGVTGVAALLDKSKHDKVLGLVLIGCAAGLGTLTKHLAQLKEVK